MAKADERHEKGATSRCLDTNSWTGIRNSEIRSTQPTDSNDRQTGFPVQLAKLAGEQKLDRIVNIRQYH